MTLHHMSNREIMALIRRIATKTYYQYFGEYDTRGPGTEHIHTLDDLCSAGKIGFLEAEKAFDPTRSTMTLKQFAAYKIRYAILDHIRKEKYKIPIPQKKRELLKKWEAIKETHENMQKTEPLEDPDALEPLGLTPDDIPKIEAMRHRYISTSSRVSSDDGESPEFETLLAEKGKTPEDMLDRKTIVDIMHDCITHIKDPLNRFILIARFFNYATLENLSSQLDCSREKVRLRQKAAEASIKKCMKRHGVTHND